MRIECGPIHFTCQIEDRNQDNCCMLLLSSVILNQHLKRMEKFNVLFHWIDLEKLYGIALQQPVLTFLALFFK